MKLHPTSASLFTLLVLLLVAAALATAVPLPPSAQLFPWVILVPTLGLCVAQLALALLRPQDRAARDKPGAVMDLASDDSLADAVVRARMLRLSLWIAGFFAAIWLLGFVIAVPLFVFAYVAVDAREPPWLALLCAALMFALLCGVFETLLHVPWPKPVLAAPQAAILDVLAPYGL
jgi:hypothetical protein